MQSWRVDVTVTNLGYLGVFRRSRDTGADFQGRHAVHMWGNAVT